MAFISFSLDFLFFWNLSLPLKIHTGTCIHASADEVLLQGLFASGSPLIVILNILHFSSFPHFLKVSLHCEQHSTFTVVGSILHFIFVQCFFMSVLAKTVGPKTLQTCHTLQLFFRLFPRLITTRFAVPLRKSVGGLCF